MPRLAFPKLYAIMDAVWLNIPERSFAEMLAEAGVQLFQYRSKHSTSRELLARSLALNQLLKPRGLRLIVNDRPDVAVLARAQGVHVGQEDLHVEQARAICGRECWVGISTHNIEQLVAADRTSADYIAVGPIFPTETKLQAAPVVGLEFIRRARQRTRKPLVAIGGITVERAAEVLRAGADSVAVARDLATARDPAGRARDYLRLADEITS